MTDYYFELSPFREGVSRYLTCDETELYRNTAESNSLYIGKCRDHDNRYGDPRLDNWGGGPVISREVTPRSHNSDPECCLLSQQPKTSQLRFSSQHIYGSLFPTRPRASGCARSSETPLAKCGFHYCAWKELFSEPTPTIRKPLTLVRMVVILCDALSNDFSCFLVPSE
jgi:hypothetical protein